MGRKNNNLFVAKMIGGRGGSPSPASLSSTAVKRIQSDYKEIKKVGR